MYMCRAYFPLTKHVQISDIYRTNLKPQLFQKEDKDKYLYKTSKAWPRAKMTFGGEVESSKAQRIILVVARIGMPTVFAVFCLGFFAYAALVPTDHAF